MLIINSSNYIPESFAYDFGEIPDIFLPIGNTRLIDILIKRLYENGESIFIILPDDFNKEKLSYSNLSHAEIFFLKELKRIFDILPVFSCFGKSIPKLLTRMDISCCEKVLILLQKLNLNW